MQYSVKDFIDCHETSSYWLCQLLLYWLLIIWLLIMSARSPIVPSSVKIHLLVNRLTAMWIERFWAFLLIFPSSVYRSNCSPNFMIDSSNDAVWPVRRCLLKVRWKKFVQRDFLFTKNPNYKFAWEIRNSKKLHNFWMESIDGKFQRRLYVIAVKKNRRMTCLRFKTPSWWPKYSLSARVKAFYNAA